MPSAIAIFILRSGVCSGILVLYYLLLLKNRKMHGFNRWYLLGTVVVSSLLPLLHFNLFQISETRAATFPLLQVMGTRVMETESVASASDGLSAATIFRLVYAAIAAIMLMMLMAKILWVYYLKHKYRAEQIHSFWLVKAPLQAAPFSFMNILFWRDDISFETEDGKRIMTHELTHMRQLHTLDKIVVQVVLACCWMNPFLWLIRKELWLQHEFIADEHAITDGDTDAFARMLLQGNYPSLVISPFNAFFYSPIKRRLMMLKQSNQTKYAPVRRLLVVPLLLLTGLIFSFTTANDTEDGIIRAGKTITLVLDAAHGGKDAGSVGNDGQREKDLTLTICRKLTLLAPAYNIRVIATREADVYPTLQDRVNKSNINEADIFLSIHLNKSTPNESHGNDYELGVTRKNVNFDQSLTLASAMVPRLKSVGITSKIVERGGIHVLKANRHTALLLECGNIDDPENLARIADDGKLETMCHGILRGIVDYQASLGRK